MPGGIRKQRLTFPHRIRQLPLSTRLKNRCRKLNIVWFVGPLLNISKMPKKWSVNIVARPSMAISDALTVITSVTCAITGMR